MSTHLIGEFEGLIDKFTIVDAGRAVLSLEADQARERFQRIRARFAGPAPGFDTHGALRVRCEGRDIDVVTVGNGERVLDEIRRLSPESCSSEALSVEEVFVATLS